MEGVFTCADVEEFHAAPAGQQVVHRRLVAVAAVVVGDRKQALGLKFTLNLAGVQVAPLCEVLGISPRRGAGPSWPAATRIPRTSPSQAITAALLRRADPSMLGTGC